ncbi:MAG: FAD-dependent oxidoreductase, partial [Planctomycetes bacterium]|nr:FAD-dependent oxidoreductase [Planctomycetota bacterium]
MQFFKPVFRNPYLKILCLVGSILLSRNLRAITVETKVDVVVYGATPAGVAAALGAAEDGCDVLLVEPTRRIGGLITCGLSHTDFHSFESLSGSYLKFAERVQSFYA